MTLLSLQVITECPKSRRKEVDQQNDYLAGIHLTQSSASWSLLRAGEEREEEGEREMNSSVADLRKHDRY